MENCAKIVNERVSAPKYFPFRLLGWFELIRMTSHEMEFRSLDSLSRVLNPTQGPREPSRSRGLAQHLP